MTTDPNSVSIHTFTLEDNHILHTHGTDDEGNTGKASLDLDTVFGNVNGSFSWGHTNFSSNARNIALSPDGSSLEAELQDDNGDFIKTSLDLLHHVVDYEGQLVYLQSWGVPHSTAHADAASWDEADARVLDQIAVVDGSPPVDRVITVSVPDSYNLVTPTAPLIRLNEPVPGAVASAIEIIGNIKTVVTIAYGATAAKQAGSCVIL